MQLLLIQLFSNVCDYTNSYVFKTICVHIHTQVVCIYYINVFLILGTPSILSTVEDAILTGYI